MVLAQWNAGSSCLGGVVSRVQITEFMGVWAPSLRHIDLPRDRVEVQIPFQ